MGGSGTFLNGLRLPHRRFHPALLATNMARRVTPLAFRTLYLKSLIISLASTRVSAQVRRNCTHQTESMKATLSKFSTSIAFFRRSFPKLTLLKWPEWMGLKLRTLSSSLIPRYCFLRTFFTNHCVYSECHYIGSIVK